MKYITSKRLKGKCLIGEINIPALTPIEERDNVLFYGENPICLATSRQAHEHFARNDDDCGMRRGELVQKIEKIMRNSSDAFQKAIRDKKCKSYKKDKDQLIWFWSHDFYIANIEDLEYILQTIK